MRARDIKLIGLLLGVLEFLPLMAFVYSGRVGADIAERFFWGAAMVAVVAPILLLFRRKPNPLLVAVAIWLCIEAFAFLVYIAPLANALFALQETAFFVAMMAVGVIYTAFSQSGLLTVDHGDRRRVRGYSVALLGLVGIGLACSVVFRGQEVLSAALPATAVFIAQMLIGAHLGKRPSDP